MKSLTPIFIVLGWLVIIVTATPIWENLSTSILSKNKLVHSNEQPYKAFEAKHTIYKEKRTANENLSTGDWIKKQKANKVEAHNFLSSLGYKQDKIGAAYSAYGKDLYKAKKYDKSIETLELAIYYDCDNKSAIYLLMAEIYAQYRDYDHSYTAANYIEKAFENGYSNYKELLNSKTYKNLSYKTEFLAGFLDAYEKQFSKDKDAMFYAYLLMGQRATNIDSSFSISPEKMFVEGKDLYHINTPFISEIFKPFVGAMEDYNYFGRENEISYHYVAINEKHSNYTSVIYRRNKTWGEQILPKRYKIATYKKDGSKISEVEIAKCGARKKCRSVNFLNNNWFVVNNHSTKWNRKIRKQKEKDGEQLIFEDLSEITIEEQQTYIIDENGKILMVNKKV